VALDAVEGAAPFVTPGGNTVNSILIAPVPVTQANLSVVVDAGWIPLDVLCQGVTGVAPCP
jgi:D-xylose transport system substrate-binding protein